MTPVITHTPKLCGLPVGAHHLGSLDRQSADVVNWSSYGQIKIFVVIFIKHSFLISL